MPTLHAFVAMRVLTTSVSEGPYVDSMSVHPSDTLKMLNMQFPSRETKPGQYFNIAILTIVTFEFATEPRLSRAQAQPSPGSTPGSRC